MSEGLSSRVFARRSTIYEYGVIMEKYIINGGNKLYGTIRVQTAKNSVLPILAATVLTDEKVTVCNIPGITDVRNMLKILNCLGCRSTYMELLWKSTL